MVIAFSSKVTEGVLNNIFLNSLVCISYNLSDTLFKDNPNKLIDLFVPVISFVIVLNILL